jgi:RNA polymerase sigma-70 factor (ECF subfamily)
VSEDLADQTLIECVQKSQGWAFDILFERYCAAIRRHLYRMLGDEAAAEDLLQETFLRVWTHARQWNGEGAFKGWLFRIATNQALNYMRSRRRRPELPLEGTGDTGDGGDNSATPAWLIDTASLGPADILDQAEESARLRQIIQALPAEKREIFRLVHQNEMSLRDAAGELGIPEGTAKSRLHYARQLLSLQWRASQAEQE